MSSVCLQDKLEEMTVRRDEVAGQVGGDNRSPLEEANNRQLEEEKSSAAARREIDGHGDSGSPAAGDGEVAAGDLFR